MTRLLWCAVAVLGLAAAGFAADPPPTLSIDDAVAEALQHSPTLEIARHERNVGRIQADRDRPAFRPDVTASASQVLRTPRVDLPGRPDEVIFPNSVSRLEIGLRQQVFQFGVGGAASRRADAMSAAADSDYRKAELDAILEVREAYVNTAYAEAMVGAAHRALDLAREHTRVTGLLVERGLQADVDRLEAQRAEAEAEAGLSQAQNGVALARANVNRLLGRPIDTEFALADPGPPPPAPGLLADLLRQAVAQRPEAQSLAHNLEAAQAGVQLAKSARLPRVDLDAGYAVQTKTVLEPRSGFSAGVTVSAPIFDTAAHRSTVREAEERAAQVRSSQKALEQGFALEIEQQRLAMREARARLDTGGRAAELAQKVLDVTNARFERGRAIQVEVLTARLGLQRALGDVEAAARDLRLAQARLDRALGLPPPAK